MATVLIVEDESQIAGFIHKYLKKDGFDTIILNDGQNVVETVKTQYPDLVLLDVMLPIKDGITCCKKIRAFSDVPVMMLTAKIDDMDRIIGLQAGADDYVCKPFNAKELVLRIKAILKRLKVPTTDLSFKLDNEAMKLTYKD
jgi:two-component system response regulator BaeR